MKEYEEIVSKLKELSKDTVIITATQPRRSNNYNFFIPLEKDEIIFIDYIGLLK